MKKIISCILAVLVMVSALSLNSYAVAVDTTVTDLRSISDPDLFYELFPEKGIRTLANSEPSVRYTVEYSADNAEETTVNLHFTLCDGGALYNANVVGVVEKTELSNGTYYISGPLDGTIIGANGSTHEIVVGFQSESGSDCISAGVTVNTEDGYLFFAFGQYEMPDEIYSEHQKLDGSPYAMSVNANEYPASTNSADTYVRRGFQHLGGGNEILEVYYNPYRQSVAATVQSDSEKVKRDSFFSTSRVNSVEVKVDTSKGGEGYVRVECFLHLPEDGPIIGNKLGQYAFDVLKILAARGIPLKGQLTWDIANSVCSTLTGNLTPKITGINITNTVATVITKVTSGTFDEVPLSIAVQLRSAGIDTCDLRTTASIQYVCTHIKDIYYVNSQDMCVDITVTVTGASG